jgi:hypothetical protein
MVGLARAQKMARGWQYVEYSGLKIEDKKQGD